MSVILLVYKKLNKQEGWVTYRFETQHGQFLYLLLLCQLKYFQTKIALYVSEEHNIVAFHSYEPVFMDESIEWMIQMTQS